MTRPYNKSNSPFDQARRLDGMRVEDAAAVMGFKTPTWYEFLENPWMQPFGKVAALRKALTPDAQRIVDREIDAILGR